MSTRWGQGHSVKRRTTAFFDVRLSRPLARGMELAIVDGIGLAPARRAVRVSASIARPSAQFMGVPSATGVPDRRD